MFRETQLTSTDRIGRAAEYLVCLDLIRRGFDAYVNPRTASPYDLVVENEDRLIRIQVKACMTVLNTTGSRGQRQPRFRFRLDNLSRYAGKVDIFAFVVLTEGLIRYYPIKDLASSGSTKMFNPTKFRADERSFERCEVFWNVGCE